ncbi:MAG: hypothetical protein GXY83_13150 [Rhodopirellula sp.]|nr:hypothetical protein [Rhodopirellula sp.]
MTTWQHIRAVLLLPFMVTVVIPAIIRSFAGFEAMPLFQSICPTNMG